MAKTMEKGTQPTIDGKRLINNFFEKETGGKHGLQDIELLNKFLAYERDVKNIDKPVYKVALLFICLNPPYWPYLQSVVQDCKNLFLPGHKVDMYAWSDIPLQPNWDGNTFGLKEMFPLEPCEWPLPTLLRFQIMLSKEELLKDYDYVLYLDSDMKIVNVIGDEVLGEGLTIARHPMYALRHNYIPPIEPNKESVAYIPRTGRVVEENGKKRFDPVYAAGGFQGGKTELWLSAMKDMKKMIDKDMDKGYIPIWNDETIWNAWLFNHPEEVQRAVVLSPAYIYPDSLIEEYYVKLWGTNYNPKIITLTKPFSLSKEGGDAIREQFKTL